MFSQFRIERGIIQILTGSAFIIVAISCCASSHMGSKKVANMVVSQVRHVYSILAMLIISALRKIIKNEKKLELLKKEKVKILDEVMEKETYKVAKEILDKFGDKSHLQGPKPLPGMSAVFKPSPGGDSQLRR